jgi:hypothetical protein
MISELRDGSYLYLRSRANDMDALMRRFRWRGALYRWPGVADEPADHITTTPLVTSLTHPPREPCASDVPVRKVTRALESVGFGYVRTRTVMRYTGPRGARGRLPLRGVVKRGTLASSRSCGRRA